MIKFGIWLGIDRGDRGKFYIDEVDIDSEYASTIRKFGLHYPEMRWQGALVRSVFIDRKIKLVWPKVGSPVGWENYHDLFNTLREAKQALIKKSFQ